MRRRHHLLPPWWNPSESLRMLYCAEFDVEIAEK
jgi:hypothetical protein